MDKIREEFKNELEHADYLTSKYGFKNALILSVVTKLSVVFLIGLIIILVYLSLETLIL